MRGLTFLSIVALLTGECAMAQSQGETTAATARVVTFLSHRSGHNILYAMKPDGTDIKAVFGGRVRDVPSIIEGVTTFSRSSLDSPKSKWSVLRFVGLRKREAGFRMAGRVTSNALGG